VLDTDLAPRLTWGYNRPAQLGQKRLHVSAEGFKGGQG
jgi:hypothetical protein